MPFFTVSILLNNGCFSNYYTFIRPFPFCAHTLLKGSDDIFFERVDNVHEALKILFGKPGMNPVTFGRHVP